MTGVESGAVACATFRVAVVKFFANLYSFLQQCCGASSEAQNQTNCKNVNIMINTGQIQNHNDTKNIYYLKQSDEGHLDDSDYMIPLAQSKVEDVIELPQDI